MVLEMYKDMFKIVAIHFSVHYKVRWHMFTGHLFIHDVKSMYDNSYFLCIYTNPHTSVKQATM